MVPISIAASGLITEYVDGTIGLTLNLLCFFTNGMGVCLSFIVHESSLTGFYRLSSC
jgi:hypothetical protein